MKVFVINGNVTSGKTTFGDFVHEILNKKNIPFLHDSSVKLVKDFLKEVGWEGKKWDGEKKDDYWRRAMHECKCWMIDNDENIFDKYALEKILEIGGENLDGILFYDIREPENITQLIEYFNENRPDIGVLSVFVERDVGKIEFNNYADQNQSNYKYDIHIDNGAGLKELYENALKFVEQYVEKDYSKEEKRELKEKAFENSYKCLSEKDNIA